jgi:argininosuccinate lyase
LVRFCEQHGLDLHEPTDDQYVAVSAHLTAEVRSVLSVAASIASRDGAGGTAPVRVMEQLAELAERVRVLTPRVTA